jgi:hypothetical protein
MGGYPRIRVYGDFADCCSWGRVASGMVVGLEANGALADACQIREMYDNDEGTMAGGAEAEVAIYVGPPNHMGVLRAVGKHRERFLFVAANSSWLPAEMMRAAAKVTTGIVAPSSWAQKVVWNQGYGFACYLWPHGVDEVFAPSEDEPKPSDVWTVLHMASTDMERKSTGALIQAWAIAMSQGKLRNARLDLVVSHNPRGVARKALEASHLGGFEMLDAVRVLNRKNLSTWRAARFYREYSAVCQPSRAEGFGLVPLEARACGVPAIMTVCTGHADHCGGSGVVAIPHGPKLGPIDDGPGAVAPTVDPELIANALIYAHENRQKLADEARCHAGEIRAEWSWPRVTKRWLESMFYAG